MAIQVVSFRCTLTNRLGRVISSTVSQDVLLNPDADLPLKALSEGLRDLKKGDRRRITLSAGEAYGYYDPELVIIRHREDAAEFRINEAVKLVRDGETLWTRVIEVAHQTVTLDGNHPLAGQDLVFEIVALDAREATADDLAAAAPGGTAH